MQYYLQKCIYVRIHSHYAYASKYFTSTRSVTKLAQRIHEQSISHEHLEFLRRTDDVIFTPFGRTTKTNKEEKVYSFNETFGRMYYTHPPPPYIYIYNIYTFLASRAIYKLFIILSYSRLVYKNSIVYTLLFFS